VESGDFFGTDITNIGRGFQLPGTTGPTGPYTAQAVIELVGFGAVVARLTKLPKVAKLALGHSMKSEMEGVIELAKDSYVPIDEGQLRDTGRTRGPFFPSSGSMEVWGSFGPAVNERGSHYAIPVHEIPEPPAKSVGGRSAHHEWGTWKYLQIPLLIRQEGMVGRIEREFDLLLGRLGI
jgi:hypothetical protein